MSDLNTLHNRVVWFDVPVIELKRASDFYAAVLNIKVEMMDADGLKFAVLAHDEGNGGCLVPGDEDMITDKGVLLYFNVNGRIHHAVSMVEANGGEVLQPIHAIGPYGYRALVRDCEGNRIALHSELDG